MRRTIKAKYEIALREKRIQERIRKQREEAYKKAHEGEKEIAIKVSDQPNTWVCKRVPKDAQPKKDIATLNMCVQCEFWTQDKICPEECPKFPFINK